MPSLRDDQTPGRRPVDVPRLLVLLDRYTVGATLAAEAALGELTDNRSMRVVLEVDRCPGITPSDLAGELGVSRSVMSRHLTRLVNAGLIDRARSSDHRRQRPLTLTPAGRQALERLSADLVGYFAAAAPTVKEVLAESDIDLGDWRGAPVPTLEAARGLVDVGTRMSEAVFGALAPYGLSQPVDRAALDYLNANEGAARPHALATELGLSRQAVTDLVDRHERAGLVRRSRPSGVSDGRAVVVTLTLRGRRAAEEVVGAFEVFGPDLARALAATLDSPSGASADNEA